MHDAVDEGGHGNEKADQWARGSDVEEGARGAHGRADEDEGAERADECRKRNEERIAGMNVVMAAREEVAEFVSQENGEESEGEGESGGQGERVAINESEGADEFVPGDGFVVGVGDGEMGAGDEASAESQHEKRTSEKQRPCGRPWWELAFVGEPRGFKARVWRGGSGGAIGKKGRHFSRKARKYAKANTPKGSNFCQVRRRAPSKLKRSRRQTTR